MALPPESTFKPTRAVFLQTGWCSFSHALCTGARIPGRKRWNKPTGTPCPNTSAAVLLTGTLPCGLAGLFARTARRTRLVAGCSYSHALLLLPPSDGSTVPCPWLTRGTCHSPQHPPTYSKTRKGESAVNSLPSLGSSRSKSIYTQPLLAAWRQPCSHIRGQQVGSHQACQTNLS